MLFEIRKDECIIWKGGKYIFKLDNVGIYFRSI